MGQITAPDIDSLSAAVPAVQPYRQIDGIGIGKSNPLRHIQQQIANSSAAKSFQHRQIHNFTKSLSGKRAFLGVGINASVPCGLAIIHRNQRNSPALPMIRKPPE